MIEVKSLHRPPTMSTTWVGYIDGDSIFILTFSSRKFEHYANDLA